MSTDLTALKTGVAALQAVVAGVQPVLQANARLNTKSVQATLTRCRPTRRTSQGAADGGGASIEATFARVLPLEVAK